MLLGFRRRTVVWPRWGSRQWGLSRIRPALSRLVPHPKTFVRAQRGMRRVPRDEDAEDEPWTLPPSRRRKAPPITGALPRTLELVLGNEIYLASDDLVPPLRNRLARLAASQNPDFYKAQAMRLPTYDKPRIIGCAEAHPHHLGLPRGCLDEVQQLLSDLNIAPVVRDERYAGEPVDVAFRGTLRSEQQVAANALLAHDTGVLSATTAFGTVIAAWLIARRSVNTLVLVHRRQLLEQWVDRLSAFLDLPAAKIGRIGGGRRKPTGVLDGGLEPSDRRFSLGQALRNGEHQTLLGFAAALAILAVKAFVAGA